MSQTFKCKSLPSLICKLIFVAAVYTICRERNARTYHDKSNQVCNVIQDVMLCVRSRIETLHDLEPSQENRRQQRAWKISEEGLDRDINQVIILQVTFPHNWVDTPLYAWRHANTLTRRKDEWRIGSHKQDNLYDGVEYPKDIANRKNNGVHCLHSTTCISKHQKKEKKGISEEGVVRRVCPFNQVFYFIKVCLCTLVQFSFWI